MVGSAVFAPRLDNPVNPHTAQLTIAVEYEVLNEDGELTTQTCHCPVLINDAALIAEIKDSIVPGTKIYLEGTLCRQAIYCDTKKANIAEMCATINTFGSRFIILKDNESTVEFDESSMPESQYDKLEDIF